MTTLPASISASSSPDRVLSIDVVRGFCMFWIIGADALFYALNAMSGGGGFIGFLAHQLDHEPWEGFRFYDGIFPTFVFIVGASLVFSLSKAVATEGRAGASRKVILRGLLIVLIGIVYYGGFAEGLEKMRLLGVLQRIGLCYLVTGLLFIWLPRKGLLMTLAAILLGYWALLMWMPVPGGTTGSFVEGANYANYIDSAYLPLRKHDGAHDPEGLLSTLPAIGTCLLGVFAGLLLRDSTLSQSQKLKTLITWSAVALAIGVLWGFQFPIIKKIWTSSYVLVAGGFSGLLLALVYGITDIKKVHRWAIPFVWLGMNAITIYLVTDLIDMSKLAKRFVGGEIKEFLNAQVARGLGDLVITLLGLLLAILFVRFLYQRKIFLRV